MRCCFAKAHFTGDYRSYSDVFVGGLERLVLYPLLHLALGDSAAGKRVDVLLRFSTNDLMVDSLRWRLLRALAFQPLAELGR